MISSVEVFTQEDIEPYDERFVKQQEGRQEGHAFKRRDATLRTQFMEM